MNNGQPLILISNDDGIFAPGIRTLAKEMKAFGRGMVVVPDKPLSALVQVIARTSPSMKP